MAFSFVCPHCHAKFLVDEEYRGQTGRCAECSKPIVMPGRMSSESETQSAKLLVEQRRKRALAATAAKIGVLLFATTFIALIGFAGMTFLLPELRIIKLRRDAYRSMTNMQLVAKALNSYAKKHGTYPTPMVRDANGVPLYSWRVLILPHLGYESLYEQFNLAESWDSSENIYIAQSMPREYQTFGGSQFISSSETAIALLCGPGTLFPASGPLGIDDVVDNREFTILVTEGLRNTNTWTSPGDINLTGSTGVGRLAGSDLGSGRDDFAIAESVAETHLLIPLSTTNNRIHALATPSGDEYVSEEEFSLKRWSEQLRKSPQ